MEESLKKKRNEMELAVLIDSTEELVKVIPYFEERYPGCNDQFQVSVSDLRIGNVIFIDKTGVLNGYNNMESFLNDPASVKKDKVYHIVSGCPGIVGFLEESLGEVEDKLNLLENKINNHGQG